MKKRGNRSSAGLQVSASELAQMGRCEKLVLFEHLLGNRRTVVQQQARERGLVEHELFYREGLMAFVQSDRKKRRFIDSSVFGESWQAGVLRRRVDGTLCPENWGRRVIWLGYRVVPSVRETLRGRPIVQVFVRLALDAVSTGLRWWSGWRRGRKCRR